MEVQDDFKELLELFNGTGEYMTAGACALPDHGVPRFSGSIDIYVPPSPENPEKVLSVLTYFGFPSLKLNDDDFQNPQSVVQRGVPPVRIDIVTSLTGVPWEDGDKGRTPVYTEILPYFFRAGNNSSPISGQGGGKKPGRYRSAW
jgi:hypothetical protein